VSKAIALSLLAIGAAYAVYRMAPAQAAAVDAVEPGGMAFIDPPAAPPSDYSEAARLLDVVNPWRIIESNVNNYQAGRSMDEKNVQAFLALIRFAEGTERNGLDPYRVCYGYSHTVQDLSDHPSLTGEWSGKVLPDAMCRGAGFGPGCVSTAAGAYQFISSTWKGCKRALGLPDFGPDSQDRAAIYLISQRGALDDVKAGRVADATNKCRREWASLPGAGYGQPERRLADLVAVYEQAGGQVA
jgi:muramidase (phage lysozyme)